MAVGAEREHEGRVELIGVGRYEASDEEAAAEVAFVVQDGWQGRGLGGIILDDINRAGGGARGGGGGRAGGRGGGGGGRRWGVRPRARSLRRWVFFSGLRGPGTGA